MATPDIRADQVRAALAGQRFATTAAVAVCDDGRLVGLLRLEDLLAAPPNALAAELLDPDAVVVPSTVDRGWRSSAPSTTAATPSR